MKTRIAKIHLMGGLALSCACARVQSGPTPATPPRLAFENVRYNGKTISGRVLVGADDPVTLDRRLIENLSLGIDSLIDCASGTRFPTIVADVLPEPATERDLLTLSSGEWFGREVEFVAFAEPFVPLSGPECIEFRLYYSPPEPGGRGHSAAIVFRARKQPEAPMPSPAPSDATAVGRDGGIPHPLHQETTTRDDAGAPGTR